MKKTFIFLVIFFFLLLGVVKSFGQEAPYRGHPGHGRPHPGPGHPGYPPPPRPYPPQPYPPSPPSSQQTLYRPIRAQINGPTSIPLTNLFDLNPYQNWHINRVTVLASGNGFVDYCSYGIGCYSQNLSPNLTYHVFPGNGDLVDLSPNGQQINLSGYVWLESVSLELYW